ncbi:MAG: L-2-amino-thiazoline-4-carboxylic acid hydrolase [Pseudomonadota bacterium]
MTTSPMTRRDFLSRGLAAAGGCSFALALGASPGLSGGDYYQRHRAQLLRDFQDTNQGAAQYLAARHGMALARELCAEAERGFGKLLPGLPQVGGEQNVMIEYVPVAAWYVAYYRPFLKRGLSAEDLGRMIYELNLMQYKATPAAQLAREGMERFSPAYLAQMKNWAAWAQKRAYPANWVARYIQGDGSDFDYGYDYSECALVKYFHSQDAMAAAPYVCINDFARSQAYGTGLARRGTLAMGYPICDFRYKQGRPVTQGWQSEVAKIKKMGGAG